MSTETCPMCSATRIVTNQIDRMSAAFILGGMHHSLSEADRAKLSRSMCDDHHASIARGYTAFIAIIDNLQAGLS